MSELSSPDSRPQKRVRLDESPSVPAESHSTQAPSIPSNSAPAAPIAPDAAKSDGNVDREARAGITEYVCPGNLGFTGVLKQRYTDFLVNEISLDGEVLHLRSLGVGRGKDRQRSGVKNGGEEEKALVKQESKEDVEMDDAEKATKNEGVRNGVGEEHTSIKQESNPEAEVEVKVKVEDSSGEEQAADVSDEDLKTLHSIFGEGTTSEILSLVKSIRSKYNRKAKDFKAVVAAPIADKELRTQAHRCLRRIFPAMLESSMEKDQSIRIKAVPPQERGTKRKRGNGRDRGGQDQDRRRGQLAWEELGGEFLHFTLYKENKDTMEVIGFLGSRINNGAKAFGWAGTKDRRACTVQRVCVKRQTAERMNHLNKQLFNAAIGDFEYQHHDLSLGDLLGNEFVISLRDCHFEQEDGLDFLQRVKLANDVVSKAVKDFADKGFINYYGLQRFGSFSASTDTVGLKLLQEDLKGAIDDLLAYSDIALAAANSTDVHTTVLVSQDDRNRAKALDIWKTTREGHRALEILPRKFSAERNIIQHLSSKNSRTGKHDRKQDWQGALMCIPRNLRLMYVHAYQSLVWNVVAGKRWTTFGDKVVEGDLVLVHEHKDKEAGVVKPQQDTIDQDGEEIINPSGENSAIKDDDLFERARPLSASEAESGKYNIFDIVLPQPGFDVEYPKNAIGEFYKEFMGTKEGGGLDPYKMRRGWKEISLSGGYRKFLARPLEPLSFEIKQYTKDDEQFVETDLQKLQKLEQNGREEHAAKGVTKFEDEEMQDQGSKKLAVVLKLQLASSQYATIALRELMKAGGVKTFKPEFMGGR